MRYFVILSTIFLCACATKTPITLKIGVNDPLAKKSTCECAWDTASREYEPMIAKIEEETGIKLQFNYHETPESLAAEITAGKYDGAVCKTWSGMVWDRDGQRKLIRVADLTRKSGKSELFGSFIVLAKGPINKLEDINGKRVIMGNKDSYEKHFLAKETFSEKSLTPSSIEETRNCITALFELHAGNADVAIVSDHSLITSCIGEKVPLKELKTLTKTNQSTPFVSFFISEKVPEKVRKNLQSILLDMTGSDLPKKLNCPGWVKPTAWEPEELKQ